MWFYISPPSEETRVQGLPVLMSQRVVPMVISSVERCGWRRVDGAEEEPKGEDGRYWCRRGEWSQCRWRERWQAVRSKTWFEDVSTELKRKPRSRMADIVEIDMLSIERWAMDEGSWILKSQTHDAVVGQSRGRASCWRHGRVAGGLSGWRRTSPRWDGGSVGRHSGKLVVPCWRWSSETRWDGFCDVENSLRRRRRLLWWVVGRCTTLTGSSECVAEELSQAKGQQMRWKAERDIDEAVAVTSRTRRGGRGGGWSRGCWGRHCTGGTVEAVAVESVRRQHGERWGRELWGHQL